ncbi:hypothetical protein FEM41_17330 [Jejubacter calystegiae]|uniref:Uncharacterized protein n=1 Tax=Jejubacter calystegiae TaxID=2579935 RepID=A0A4P8YKJ8_9ENTR|nr:hypothetical protein [Jejubacter calystegiae]QCT21285.1 hypothetical protein FEM41_17330 [Jejubacter calystegiae]
MNVLCRAQINFSCKELTDDCLPRNSVICNAIAKAIAGKGSLFVALRGGVIGNLLLIGGMTERCIRTSEKLRDEDPQLYYKLRAKDYDLLYFILEPALKPFVDATRVRRTEGEDAFNTIINMVEKKVNSGHG